MGKKVLVVDDSASVRQQVSLALGQAGFQVLEASDGKEGAAAVATDRQISIVICDVNMPNMNGLEMLAAVKAKPENAALPVLMLTTEGHPKLIKEAKASGAKGWILKPFKADQLVATVQKLTAS